MIMDVTALFLILHAPDGHEVRISPDQITSLHSGKIGVKKEDRLYLESVKCLVNFTDGKFISVVEPCDVIQRMMEGKP